jgi:two-component system CheB/CheR fusion protein
VRPASAIPAAAPPPDERESAQLRQELVEARAYLQSIIEQKEAANEELKAANEEILSGNEELQSTNEELETAKEELQSVNEELTTVNEQLQHRNVELTQLNNDLNNLLRSTSIPIVMLESDLRIRRFTATAGELLDLLPTDVGRSVTGIRTAIDVPDLEPMIREVIATAQSREREVQDHAGRWYTLRIHPYRTADNTIDGAVVALLDIHELKSAQETIRAARDYAQAVVATVRDPLLVLDAELRVNTANSSFYESFQVSPQVTEGRLIYDLGDGQWNTPELRRLLAEILSQRTQLNDFEVQHMFPTIGHKTMLLNARRIVAEDDRAALILLAIEDITERKRAEEQVRMHLEELTRFNRVAIGRELRMIELKREINGLYQRHGEAARYPLEFEQDGNDTDD